jgi:hypothetical protein
MHVFLEHGRLGNQLFQYSAVRSMSSADERVVLVGFDALRQAMDGVDATFVAPYSSLLGTMVRRNLKRIDRIVPRIPGVGLRWEESEGMVGQRKGLLPVSYVRSGFFQSDSYISSDAVASLRPRSDHLARAREFLADRIGPGTDIAFVHIRRGDYTREPSREAPAVLPLVWFHESMRQLEHSLPGCSFVIVTDDQPYAEEFFSNQSNVFISPLSADGDLALMSLCSGGVLSASSFSWWGAFFSARAGQGPFLAPKYWMGHRTGRWTPRELKSGFLTFID